MELFLQEAADPAFIRSLKSEYFYSLPKKKKKIIKVYSLQKVNFKNFRGKKIHAYFGVAD